MEEPDGSKTALYSKIEDYLLLDNQRDIVVLFRLDVFAYFMLETYKIDLQPLPRNTGKAVKVYTVSSLE
jgi:hypothetical protein